MNLFLKLFYKPEEVILPRLEPKVSWAHLGILAIPVVLAIMTNTMSQGKPLNLMTIIPGMLGGFVGVAIVLLIYSYVLKLLGLLVGGKATTNEIAISQIYMIIPAITINIVLNLIVILTGVITENDVDIYINMLMVSSILWIFIGAYFIFLNIKVISAVQQVSFNKGIINYSIFIIFAIFSLIGNINFIMAGFDQVKRENMKTNINFSNSIDDLQNKMFDN
ncbi:MAG TPA: hypothetical protein DEG71_11855 [Clostridiales bacterium]|nr:hypothetical protein [Clostridiales bacterium]